MIIEQYKPLHPGEFIRRVYLEPFGIRSNELSRRLGVSPGVISRLLRGKTDISTAMALRLSRVLGRSPESWLLMQGNFNLWKEKSLVDFSDLEPFDFDGMQTA
ncbi:HigA family addiction module antitoxin [Desulfobacter sp.]